MEEIKKIIKIKKKNKYNVIWEKNGKNMKIEILKNIYTMLCRQEKNIKIEKNN